MRHLNLQVRVLNKKPKGKDVSDGDLFHFNTSFSEKLYHIKMSALRAFAGAGAEQGAQG